MMKDLAAGSNRLLIIFLPLSKEASRSSLSRANLRACTNYGMSIIPILNLPTFEFIEASLSEGFTLHLPSRLNP